MSTMQDKLNALESGVQSGKHSASGPSAPGGSMSPESASHPVPRPSLG
jgi:hypothetical protein